MLGKVIFLISVIAIILFIIYPSSSSLNYAVFVLFYFLFKEICRCLSNKEAILDKLMKKLNFKLKKKNFVLIHLTLWMKAFLIIKKKNTIYTEKFLFYFLF